MAYGQFFIAFANANETTFGPQHQLLEFPFSRFALQQAENEFATVTIITPNPRVGLLNPDRKKYAWFAFDFGTPHGVQPLLFGRIVGLPEDVSKTQVQILYRARPADFQALKEALAFTLRVPPYWDPLWFNPEDRENPDLVLQARSSLWHVDRLTHEVTISNNIVGEDGTLTFTQDDILEDSLSCKPTGLAANVARVRAEMHWTQRATGVIDLGPYIVTASNAGLDAADRDPFMVQSYTYLGLVSEWPVPGDDFGGGWTVENANVADGNGLWISESQIQTTQLSSWISAWAGKIFAPEDTTEVQVEAQFRLGSLKAALTARYIAERSWTEIVEFDLVSDVQAMLSEDDESAIINIDLASNDASEPIELDESGNMAAPLQDVRLNSYIKTDRGIQSLEYLIARARAELLDHARVVETTFTVPWHHILDLSCRKNCLVISDDIPGGQVVGKIKAYSAAVDSESGQATCTITIASTVGYGNAVTADPGTPDYCEDDYCEYNYQMHSDAVHLLEPGDVTWNEFRQFVPADDGWNFTDVKASDAVLEVIMTNNHAEQRAHMYAAGGVVGGVTTLESFFPDMTQAQDTLNEKFTTICVHLKPTEGGPFETPVAITLSDLMVPMQINMEAEAA